MPIKALCPNCGLKLGIPDELVGRNVRCSKCQTEFLAQAEMPVEIMEAPAPPVVSGPLPSELPEAMQDFDDDRDNEGRRRGRKRRRRRVSDPTAQLMLPGWFLVATAIAGGLVGEGSAVFWLIAQLGATPRGGRGGGDVVVFAIFGFIIQTLITLAWSGAVFRGGMSMVKLHHYQTAIAGCIVAMLPCNIGCCAGIPVGIWGLIVLLQDDVKRAF
jgi:hypothetical protein